MNYIEAINTKHPGVFVSCIGDPSVYENLVWESGLPLPDQTTLDADVLQCSRDSTWLKIKAVRDSRKAGGVHIGANWYHSDDSSRIQQIGLVMMGANIPSGLQWKTMSGSFVTMTQTLAMQIFGAVAASDQAIFAKAEYHKAQMLLSTDPESYDYSGGWPQTYEESIA